MEQVYGTINLTQALRYAAEDDGWHPDERAAFTRLADAGNGIKNTAGNDIFIKTVPTGTELKASGFVFMANQPDPFSTAIGRVEKEAKKTRKCSLEGVLPFGSRMKGETRPKEKRGAALTPAQVVALQRQREKAMAILRAR